MTVTAHLLIVHVVYKVTMCVRCGCALTVGYMAAKACGVDDESRHVRHCYTVLLTWCVPGQHCLKPWLGAASKFLETYIFASNVGLFVEGRNICSLQLEGICGVTLLKLCLFLLFVGVQRKKAKEIAGEKEGKSTPH